MVLLALLVAAVGCGAESDPAAVSGEGGDAGQSGSAGTPESGAGPSLADPGVTLALSPACTDEGGPAGEMRPTGETQPTVEERTEGDGVPVQLPHGGADRTYLLHTPADPADEPAPLVVDLHGYVSGAGFQTALSGTPELTETHGAVVAAPQGSGDLAYWNAVPHRHLPDDVAFVGAVIDDVGERLCVDLDRVHVMGFSNGAFLTSLIACELADRVASVAAVAGLLDPAGCDPARPVPVLAVHGTDDEFVSAGGPPNPALDTLEWNEESRAAFAGLAFDDVGATAAAWAQRNSCDAEPSTQAVGPAVQERSWTGCEHGADVVLFVVDGGGHTWPGSELSTASAEVLGATTDEIDATEVIWSFFENHPRSG